MPSTYSSMTRGTWIALSLVMVSIGSKATGQQRDPPPPLPERPTIGTVCLVFLSLVACVFLLHYAQAFFLPFVLSLLLFYALDPIVSWISSVGIPRVLASMVLICILLGGAGLAIYSLRGQAGDL